MLSEYHGRSVAGGTYPALIWKAFMEKALPTAAHAEPFPAPSIPYALGRDGASSATAGSSGTTALCKGTDVVELFSTATATDRELQAKRGPGARRPRHAARKAKARLLLQPLKARVIWTEAKPGERLGVVLRQTPTSGTLAAYDRVKLFVARANGRLKKARCRQAP